MSRHYLAAVAGSDRISRLPRTVSASELSVVADVRVGPPPGSRAMILARLLLPCVMRAAAAESDSQLRARNPKRRQAFEAAAWQPHDDLGQAAADLRNSRKAHLRMSKTSNWALLGGPSSGDRSIFLAKLLLPFGMCVAQHMLQPKAEAPFCSPHAGFSKAQRFRC